ncbi:MAG: phosphatase PAP2 family protein [Magnetococcales bacterium]|nr:phosphatase PAP2 family protein [Magnetococcales bacterium]
MKPGRVRFWWVVLLAGVTLLVAENSGADLWIQDFFFDVASGQWWIDKDDPTWRLIFYTGAKRVVVAVAIALLILVGWSWQTRGRPGRGPLLMVLALLLVPGVISGLKNISNVHCPWSLSRYGGTLPYVPVLAAQPEDFPGVRPGKCFPAGHPSGGFAFMMLFHLFAGRARWIGLGTGVALGWIMGLYQMMKGAHYFSHVVISMLMAWLIILGIVALVDRWLARKLPE